MTNRFRPVARFTGALVLLAGLLAVSSSAQAEVFAAAASLQPVMEKVAIQFEKEKGIRMDAVFGACFAAIAKRRSRWFATLSAPTISPQVPWAGVPRSIHVRRRSQDSASSPRSWCPARRCRTSPVVPAR